MDARWSIEGSNDVRLPRTFRLKRKVDTMSPSALFVHVPVDRLTIVNGPSAQVMHHHYIRLLGMPADSTAYEQVVFTFRTAASSQTFKRFVRLANITPNDGSGFLEPVKSVDLNGIFCGTYVEGDYDMDTRRGSLYQG